MDNNNETAGYKFGGVVKEFDPMGETLKPVFDVEITDMENKDQKKIYNDHIKTLQEGVDTRDFFDVSKHKVDPALVKKRIQENPGDLYVKADGKKTSLAKHVKNRKSLNTRKNYDFSKLDDKRFDKDNNNMQKSNPDNYQSMVFNTPKDGE